jgi:hypothetical protein
MYRGTNAPQGTAISYHLKAAPSGEVKLTISDITGKVVRTIAATEDVGLNRVQWNLRGDPPPRPAGFGGGGFGGGGNAPAAQASGNQPAGQAAGATQPGQDGGRGGGGGGGQVGGGGRSFGANFGPALEPGVYLVKLTVDGKDLTTKVVIEADPNK